MAKTRDAKRREKITQKAKRQADYEVTPYSGEKYRSDSWQPYVYSTEMAVYDAILRSHRRLTNNTVQHVFETLVRRLRRGVAPTLETDEIEIGYSAENEVEYLVQDIRRKWALVFEAIGPQPVADMIGILRTLLYSIRAHASHTGSTRGYVDFVWGFIGQAAEPGEPAPIMWQVSATSELVSKLGNVESDVDNDDEVISNEWRRQRAIENC